VAVEDEMLKGSNVTVYVSDLDRAVRFYTETLGLTLRQRFGDHWAEVDAGGGLVIGLHPATEQRPAGRRGSIAIGFSVDGSMEGVVQTLIARGVRFEGGITDDKAGKFANFSDADGHPCYLFQVYAEYAAR
jgi:catechol 2,3-dioxygenase-like lactoylglutathione lyase family enzyme